MSHRHVALVTGGSRGIGSAIAQQLGAAGAHVIVSALDLAACENVARLIQSLGGSAEAIALDVASKDGIRAGALRVQGIEARVGPVDWLVNNAGIVHSAPLFSEHNEDALERLMGVNFHGPRRLVESLAPSMRTRGYGRIVNIVSSAGLRGYKYVSVYCASKHALLGWTRAAALDLAGTGVTINAICPHYVDSPMTDKNIARMREKTGKSETELRGFLAAQNPGGRLVTPQDVAREVLALMEGSANGRVVELDGSGPKILEEVSA